MVRLMPRTAAEWAKKCDEKPDSHHLSALYMCLHCADAYAREQVAAHQAVVEAAKKLDAWSQAWNREFAMEEFRQLHEALVVAALREGRDD